MDAEILCAALAFVIVGAITVFFFIRAHKVDYQWPLVSDVIGLEQRYEFLREKDGKFERTGEMVPLGQDPHIAVETRSHREGVSYSATRI